MDVCACKLKKNMDAPHTNAYQVREYSELHLMKKNYHNVWTSPPSGQGKALASETLMGGPLIMMMIMMFS
jgi:hypothetical protein